MVCTSCGNPLAVHRDGEAPAHRDEARARQAGCTKVTLFDLRDCVDAYWLRMDEAAAR